METIMESSMEESPMKAAAVEATAAIGIRRRHRHPTQAVGEA
jgi:hypothetical protein